MRWVSGAAGVLLLSLGVIACTDDSGTDASAGASSRPSTSASPSAPADPAKLSCDGYASSGIIDYAGPALVNGKPVYPPNSATPESIARGFERGLMARHIKGWDLDRPPVREVVRTNGKEQTRRATVYYRNPDGRIVAILGLSRERGAGWRLEQTQNCTYGPDEPRPTPVPLPAPQLIVNRAVFHPQIQFDGLSLDCSGGRVTGMTLDGTPNPKAKPLTDPDPETDGLIALVRRLTRQYPGIGAWEGSRPPKPVLLYPRHPASSMRAGVRLVSPSGKVRIIYYVERAVARGAWHVVSYRACA